MEIREVNPADYGWNKTGNYAKLYEAIEQLRVDKAIEIDLDEPHATLGVTVCHHLKVMKAPYKIKTKRLTRDGKRWVMLKVNKKGATKDEISAV